MSAPMGLADDLDRELARPAPASPDTEPDDPRIIRIHPERVTVLRDTYGVTPKTNKDVTGSGWRLAILVSEEPEQAPAEVRAKLEAALEVVAPRPPLLGYDRVTGDEKEADDYVNARCSRSLSSLELAGLLSLQWDRAWPFAHIEDEALPWASARAWIFRGHVVVTEDSDGHGAETASQREMAESAWRASPQRRGRRSKLSSCDCVRRSITTRRSRGMHWKHVWPTSYSWATKHSSCWAGQRRPRRNAALASTFRAK